MTEAEADRAATARNRLLGEARDPYRYAIAVEQDDGSWTVKIRSNEPEGLVRKVLRSLPWT